MASLAEYKARAEQAEQLLDQLSKRVDEIERAAQASQGSAPAGGSGAGATEAMVQQLLKIRAQLVEEQKETDAKLAAFEAQAQKDKYRIEHLVRELEKAEKKAPAAEEKKQQKAQKGKKNKGGNKQEGKQDGGKKGKGKKGKGGKGDNKALKNAVKEGGKKAQDIAGTSEMGGLSYYCVTMEKCRANMELLSAAMDAMNVPCPEDAEERRGGAENLGKCLLSHNDDRLAIIAHIPDNRVSEINCREWMEYALQNCELEAKDVAVEPFSDTYCKIMVHKDADKNVYPGKMHDMFISHAIVYLQNKKVYPQDDEDSDDDYNPACEFDW